MSVDVKYRTTATATGGRDGQATTTDGSLNIKLATPKELGGAGARGTTRNSFSPPDMPLALWGR